MSYPKINNTNDQILGYFNVNPVLKVLREEKLVEFSVGSFSVEENDEVNRLIDEGKIKLAFTLECDSTFKKTTGFYGDKIRWGHEEIGGKLRSSCFLLCVEPFKIDPSNGFLDEFYENEIKFKKNYLVSHQIIDEYNLKKLNIGSSIDFIKIKHESSLVNREYEFWSDETQVKLRIKDESTYKLAKQMLKRKNVSSIVKNLLFFPFFMHALDEISDLDNQKEWHEDFRKMIGIEKDNEIDDFDNKFNLLVEKLGNKTTITDSLKESLTKLDKLVKG